MFHNQNYHSFHRRSWRCTTAFFDPASDFWNGLSPIEFTTRLFSSRCPLRKQKVFIATFRNKAKGTLVPERGWKYYILPTKVHPQTSFPEFGPRIQPQNSAPEFGPKIRFQNSASELGPRIWPQNSAPEFGSRIRPQPSFGSRYLFQGLQPNSMPRCLA